MNQDRKYFGMTVTQLGILGGLAGIAFLLICVTGWLVIKKGSGASSAQSVLATATPEQPTATLVLTPTLTPTPGPTPIPYATLIPAGWAQYRTALYEIWMLPGYKTAKTINVLTTGLGGNPILDLSLKGSYATKSPNRIYLTISYEPMTGDTFDAFIVTRLTNLGLAPSERNKVTVNTVPAVRMIFSGRRGNNDINELTYVILDGTTVWYVQYTAEINEFYKLLDSFEASVKTFRVVK